MNLDQPDQTETDKWDQKTYIQNMFRHNNNWPYNLLNAFKSQQSQISKLKTHQEETMM